MCRMCSKFKCVVIILLMRSNFAEPQFDVFRPVSSIFNAFTGNSFSQQNQQTQTNHESQETSSPNYQPQPQSRGFRFGGSGSGGGTCASYWSIRSDSNGRYGLLSIPNPDRSHNILKIQLTLAAQVSSVSQDQIINENVR